MKGRKSHIESHEDKQALFPGEEAELVQWITQLMVTGISSSSRNLLWHGRGFEAMLHPAN